MQLCSSKKQAILKAIIALGHALEVNIVAECVENARQKNFLLQLGCHEGQGYFWYKQTISRLGTHARR